MTAPLSRLNEGLVCPTTVWPSWRRDARRLQPSSVRVIHGEPMTFSLLPKEANCCDAATD